MKKNYNAPQGPRVNYQIKSPRVLVVHDGQKLGEMPPKAAIEKARTFGLDLIEVSPTARPPVCLITDYGKWKYDQGKKQKQSNANSTKNEIKTVRLRQNTEDNDVLTKLRMIRRFLEEDKKVQVVIKSKGRELAHKDRGFEILNKILEDVKDIAELESKPHMAGSEVSCRLQPL